VGVLEYLKKEENVTKSYFLMQKLLNLFLYVTLLRYIRDTGSSGQNKREWISKKLYFCILKNNIMKPLQQKR